MAFLAGLKDYLAKNDQQSIFDTAAASDTVWQLHLHGDREQQGTVAENKTYDIVFTAEDGGQTEIPKVQIKMLYPAEYAERVQALIKIDGKVKEQGLEPILAPQHRHFIKNKSLFPLMRENEVLFFTLLEGEVLRGLIQNFNRYEITMTLKGKEPVTLLRHAVLDVRNKQGRCFLKESQQALRDWTKSGLYIDLKPRKKLKPGQKKIKIKRRKKVIIR